MVEARSFNTTEAASQNVMNVRATVVATTTLVVVVELLEIVGTVCIDYVMPIPAQLPREHPLANRPPAPAAAHHHYRFRRERFPDRFFAVAAKPYLDRGVHFLFAHHPQQSPLGKLNRNGRLLQRQRIRNHLRRQNRDTSPQIARQLSREFEGGLGAG